MCCKGITYLTQPNPTKYTFRPHPCSYLDWIFVILAQKNLTIFLKW
jgi:hypothetical protein